MADLNLQQIVDKLNAEFSGAGRRLVFWYDEAGEFAEDIDSFQLVNAKVYHLESNAQFKAKVFFERQDTVNNYLIYAPFPKPALRDNHLADTLRYSSEFSATRSALICRDLRIPDSGRPLIQHFIDLRLLNKENTRRLCALEMDFVNSDSIYLAMMAILCRAKTASFENILCTLIATDQSDELLAEFQKYELLSPFWQFCQNQFGYNDGNPTFDKLLISLLVTEAYHTLHDALPPQWEPYRAARSGNVIAFLETFKNNRNYTASYDVLANRVANALHAKELLAKVPPESLLACDTFAVIDSILCTWLAERLLAEDIGSILRGLTIPQICQARQRLHFHPYVDTIYEMLSHACELILAARRNTPFELETLIRDYRERGWRMDYHYRKFYQAYESLDETSDFEKLRDLIENIYSESLGKLLPVWNQCFCQNANAGIPRQGSFYTSHVASCKERVLVIISDAMRYEVARELSDLLQDHEKCTVKLDAMTGVLPSFTPLGMAALLPHKKLTLTSDGKASCDGLPTYDLAHREAVLKTANANSLCVRFDDINRMKRQDLRQHISGKEIIYIYHNQIDARGEAAATENELFTACSEAVQELHDFVIKMTDTISTTHYIVTADHGFLYRHAKLHEYDKLSAQSHAILAERRFMLLKEPVSDDGIATLPMARFTSPEDPNLVAFPVGIDVFKTGGGMNYVHGGSSPQELLIPVLDIRTARGHQDTESAAISIVSMVPKVTNLITTLEFLQTEPVSDTIKSAKYRIRFEDGSGNAISNELTYLAESREKEPQRRLFQLRFMLKNQKYERSKPYYLVAYGEHDLETIRHEVVIDIAFADDFGFNL